VTGPKRRPKGSGGIRNRGTDRAPRWFAFHYIRVDGKRVQRTEGPFRRKADAESWLRDELKRVSEGRGTVSTRLTTAELLDQWLDANSHRLARSTHGEYQRHLSETSLQPTLSTLRSALDWAVRHRLVAYNQAKDVDRPQREDVEMTVWTFDELGRFMSFVNPKRFYPLLRLAAFTGMRRSELLGLKWRDVDLEDAILRVRRVRYKVGYEMVEAERTKSRRGRRVIDLDPTTVDVLAAWQLAQDAERKAWGLAYADSGMVFTAEDGQASMPIDWLRPSTVSSWPLRCR